MEIQLRSYPQNFTILHIYVLWYTCRPWSFADFKVTWDRTGEQDQRRRRAAADESGPLDGYSGQPCILYTHRLLSPKHVIVSCLHRKVVQESLKLSWTDMNVRKTFIDIEDNIEVNLTCGKLCWYRWIFPYCSSLQKFNIAFQHWHPCLCTLLMVYSIQSLAQTFYVWQYMDVWSLSMDVHQVLSHQFGW